MLLPSDHYISDMEKYLITMSRALNYVEKLGICTIGITIDQANTNYGYIKAKKLIASNIYQTDFFIEKPSLELAQMYANNDNYFWNSGIYVYNVDFLLEQVKKFQPDLLDIAKSSLNKAIANVDDIIDFSELKLNYHFNDQISNISFDKAIVARIPEMIMVKANFTWHDLGNWRAVYQAKEKDQTNNYCEGNVIASDTRNSYISSTSTLTTVIGMNHVIIVNTNNGLLVADIAKIEDLGKIINLQD